MSPHDSSGVGGGPRLFQPHLNHHQAQLCLRLGPRLLHGELRVGDESGPPVGRPVRVASGRSARRVVGPRRRSQKSGQSRLLPISRIVSANPVAPSGSRYSEKGRHRAGSRFLAPTALRPSNRAGLRGHCGTLDPVRIVAAQQRCGRCGWLECSRGFPETPRCLHFYVAPLPIQQWTSRRLSAFIGG